MKQLPRLTAERLHRAEAKGKTRGWYELCRSGYLPAEISLYAEPVITAGDIVTAVRNYAEARELPVPVSCARKRTRGVAAPPEDWRAAFRATVMRTGLVLNLTQPMLEYLCATADGVMWDRWGQNGSSLARPNNTITTAASLEKRGLIRRKPGSEVMRRDNFEESYHELTEAGECVVGLLRSVGVFVESDHAIARKRGAK
ncbi:MAG TPA: hypothetical protein VIM84_00030 [Gemmatimonadales bacterium]